MYKLANYRKFKGHEGEPLAQGRLTLNGKKVCDWSDDFSGGAMRINFITKVDEDAFVEHAKTFLASRKDYDGELFKVNLMPDGDLIERAIFAMSIEYAERSELERLVKKGIVVKVLEKGKEVVYTHKSQYSPGNVLRIKAKYGSSLLEIVNETLGVALMDDATANYKAETEHYRKQCKTSAVFSIRNDDGSIKVMKSNRAYSEATAAYIRAKYPTLIELFNERYL